MSENELNGNVEIDKPRLLADQLPVLRKMLDLSQWQFAKEIGVSRATLSSIETGTREMSRTVYLACLAVLCRDSQTRAYLQHLNILDQNTGGSI